MASEAPSWADQWGTGGIGAMPEEDAASKKDNKKKTDSKGGMNKAKAAAVLGAQKIKTGASNGIKWVKNKCQKKGTVQ